MKHLAIALPGALWAVPFLALLLLRLPYSAHDLSRMAQVVVLLGISLCWALQRTAAWRGACQFRWIGAVLLALGGVLLIETFSRFALQGLGTPAPIAPTKTLVVTGSYRFVRNPMYVAVVSLILGQALWFGSVGTLGWGAVVWLTVHAFVLAYEEPTLASTYGEQYDRYRANVRRWIPRLTPWSA